MSFTLYLLIQIPLITTLVCLVIYQHRLYSKQKKLVKEMIERDIYGLEDEYSTPKLKSYAEHCMRKLLTKYPNGEDGMGEISSYDVYRIKRVLNQNKEDE